MLSMQKKDVKNMVIRADQLIAYIKNAVRESKEVSSSDKEMKEWADKLLALHKPNRSDYAKKYEDIINSLSVSTVEVERVQPIVAQKAKEPIPVTTPAEPLIRANEDLAAKLKAFRLEKSREENIKAYCVFSDKHMQDLISKMPRSRTELLSVTGFGPVKVEKYGPAILELLKYNVSTDIP